jgi:squalene-associated FAD-dependent desaturase
VTPSGSPDVVIIGAGFAGLSAATALAERGARVLVLDARPRLGGRATAFVDRVTGELVDNGQHVLFGCYRATFRFLERIDALDHVRVQPQLEVPYLDLTGRRSVLKCPPLPAPWHLLAAVLKWEPMSWRDRLSALKLAAPLRRARRELQRTGTVTVDPAFTVSTWLQAHGQSDRLRQWLWEPLAVAALNQSPDVASAAPFVRVLAEMFGPDPAAAAIVLPTRPLDQMYAIPARRFIEDRRGEIRVNAVARIFVRNARLEGVDIRGERVLAGKVVSAVPWFGLRGLFALECPAPLASTVAAANAMDSMPIVTVNLWYDRAVMDDVFVGLPGRAIQWVFDKRLAFGGTAAHLSLVSSNAGALSPLGRDELVAMAAREIEEALPGARGARLVRGTVVRERQATFSLAPGQPPRPAARTEVQGLVLAGDWIETGLPGTIESAVLSGEIAAGEIAD